jgi:hypothetical protein
LFINKRTLKDTVHLCNALSIFSIFWKIKKSSEFYPNRRSIEIPHLGNEVVKELLLLTHVDKRKTIHTQKDTFGVIAGLEQMVHLQNTLPEEYIS